MPRLPASSARSCPALLAFDRKARPRRRPQELPARRPRAVDPAERCEFHRFAFVRIYFLGGEVGANELEGDEGAVAVRRMEGFVVGGEEEELA